VERYVREKKDPYKIDRDVNDGEGFKLTTPGSEGMLGQKADPGYQAGGKERKGYPDRYSLFSDDADSEKFDEIPSALDSNPEDPFTGKSKDQTDRAEYGGGQGTDYGEALHDDANVHTENGADAALGIGETVRRELSGNDFDRTAPISNMAKKPENPFNERLKKGPMNYVTERLRSASRRS